MVFTLCPVKTPPSLHPALLAPGTLVGPWRVLDWVSRGVNGAVYRAVRIGQEHVPPVALKLALLPEDPRSCASASCCPAAPPHIPRLVDSGFWVSPSGARYPFIAMEWVDGVPLYDWARMFRPSAAQQLRLLSQAALTLQYLHAQDALHRDFKGDNLLVRRFDSRLFVIDFGSSIYPDADLAHSAAAASGHSRLPLPRGLALHPAPPPRLGALPPRARG